MRHWGLIAAVLACALTACSSGSADDDDAGGTGPTNAPSTPATPGSEHAVATFAVMDEEFKIELVTPDLVEHAQRLLDARTCPRSPSAGSCVASPVSMRPGRGTSTRQACSSPMPPSRCATASRPSSRTRRSPPRTTAPGRPRSWRSIRPPDRQGREFATERVDRRGRTRLPELSRGDSSYTCQSW